MKRRKLAEPRQDSKEKSEDKESAPVSNIERSTAEGVDVFIAPEYEELEEEEDNPLAFCLPDTFTIRKFPGSFLWYSRYITGLVHIISEQPVSICLLCASEVYSDNGSLRSTTGFGPWTDTLFVVHSGYYPAD